MASTRLKTTKNGTPFYEIRVRMGRGKPELTQRWYPPEGWSQKAIDRELAKVSSAFERQCHNGEILTKKEQQQKDAQKAAKAARILTLKQYAEQVFMPRITVSGSENTRDSYQRNLNNWIYPAMGDLRLPDITPSEIEALLLSMQSAGKANGTVVKVYIILSGLFKLAYRTDQIDKNPMEKIDRPKPRKDEIVASGAEAYTPDELRIILKALEREPLKWRVLVLLLIDTGIRRGECCALRWENIDFATNQITIAGNLCYTAAKGVYLDTPKNRKSRCIDIDPAISAMLRELRQEQSHHAISPYVFSQDGKAEPMHPHSPTRHLKKFSERSDIPDLHPHKLRHSFASVAITHGADVASVSEKLGHSDKAITLRMYTHANEESMRQTSAIFRNALKPPKEIKQA